MRCKHLNAVYKYPEQSISEKNLKSFVVRQTVMKISCIKTFYFLHTTNWFWLTFNFKAKPNQTKYFNEISQCCQKHLCYQVSSTEVSWYKLIVLLDMEVLMKIGVFVFGVGNNTRALSVEKTLKKSEQLYWRTEEEE